MSARLEDPGLQIHAIWISPGHDFKGRYGQERLNHGMVALDEVECHAGRGLVGDRFYDYEPDFKGQTTFFDLAVAQQLQRELAVPELNFSAFRRNLLVSGTDLNQLIGKTFVLNGIVFEATEECAPCFWMDEAIWPGAFAWLKGRGGLRARIHTSGVLRCRMPSH